ncbi:MAG: UDP-N-acetylenolpyruvoylglucosamine reductase [Verrucomicrobia bacterium RIFCSPHIGHO2_12_FULL_41_10]|nr:MAG: UDP-N-acetylenolpyruvoylglucosamine reductase [Verrucomicrobia bacterium RIFCSPHIGHO2_12_FULL_41_10]
MSGLAALLLDLGHRVVGSDRVTTEEVERLSKKGLVFIMQHRAEEAHQADLVVYSSAIHSGNPTLDEAERLGKRRARRAEVLAALMNGKRGIVICGMHGKTTTSSMAAHILSEAGVSSSHYVGAEIPILGTNARWSSQGDYFVAEGDESDGTLVYYSPEHTILLNIEPEHLDFYKDIAAIDAVYEQLLKQTTGIIFYWADDPGAARVCAGHPRALAVGLSHHCDYRYEGLTQQKFSSRFDVIAKNKNLGSIELGIPGVHNVSNAMLVIALGLELDLPFEKMAAAFKSFRGAKRRLELKYEGEDFLVLDDYGHHPTEIAATLATVRSIMGGEARGRLIVMFQPHRYSRTVAFQKEFGQVLLGADIVFVTEIYPASEEPLVGITGKTIVESAQEQGHSAVFYESVLENLPARVAAVMKEGDVILSLGAGNIHEAGQQFVEDLKKRDHFLSFIGSGTVKLYEPLSRHTTMRVGGPAQFWVEPETEEGFARLVQACFQEKIPLMVMGRGSNLIVRDGGISGVVVHLVRGCFAQCHTEGAKISAGVGVKLKQLSAIAHQAGLGGLEWMDGIPGNLGGSLRMNAGAMGSETFDQLLCLRCVNQEGQIMTLSREELEVCYRNVPFLKNHYALSATFQGKECSKEDREKLLKASFTHRRETQPIAASAGCIFKNPLPTLSAGRLVDELGLKNRTVGHARVSEVHGNFIVNDGGATATEVLQLIEEIKNVALKERGIKLETEVQIVGKE